MKTIAFVALAATVLASNAQANTLSCPAETSTVLSCTKADQPGDHEVALNFMDAAVICARGDAKFMIINAGEPSPEVTVEEIVRVGATSYVYDAGEGRTFTLARRVVSPTSEVNASFSIRLYSDDLTSTRSLKCD